MSFSKRGCARPVEPVEAKNGWGAHVLPTREMVIMNARTGTLALAVGTPPRPDADRFGGAHRTGIVVMAGELLHGNVGRAVEGDKREVCQLDLVNTDEV